MKKYYSFFLLILTILFNSCSSDDSKPETNSEKLLKTFSSQADELALMSYDSNGNLTAYKIEYGTDVYLDMKFVWENGFPKQITTIYSESNDTSILNFEYFTNTKARGIGQSLNSDPSDFIIYDYTFSDGLIKSQIISKAGTGVALIEIYYSHDAKGNLTNIKRVVKADPSDPLTSDFDQYFVATEWDEGKKPLPHFGAYIAFEKWEEDPPLGYELSKSNVISYTISNSYSNSLKVVNNEYEYDSEGYVTSIQSNNEEKYYLTYY